jgi:thioredoxin-like negative regulator of GroEL
MVQGDNPAAAGTHLRRAIELEPESPAYIYTLAQYLYRNQDSAAALATLMPILKPNIDLVIRAHAQSLIQENTH